MLKKQTINKKPMEKPFYLQGKGPNIITKEDIELFASKNPELIPFLQQHKIELKLLDISEFESLVFWIVSQQISGKVANILIKRLKERFPEFTPRKVLESEDNMLSDIGLSKQKIKYVKNVAKYFIEHENIDLRKFSDEEIIKELTKIKGVGEWTAQMHMIFSEGRKNVLAIKDLGVRKGLQILYDLPVIPSEKEAKKLCLKWPPRATVGTLLSWSVIGES